LFVIPGMHPIRNGWANYLRDTADQIYPMMSWDLNPDSSDDDPSRYSVIYIGPRVDGTASNRPQFADIHFNGRTFGLVLFIWGNTEGDRVDIANDLGRQPYDNLIPRKARRVHRTEGCII